MSARLKTKGFKKKLSRVEKNRRKIGLKIAKANGTSFVIEAINRTQLADPTTTATYGEGGQVIEHTAPVPTPNYGFSVSGWKKAANRLRVPFWAPHIGGSQLGRASIKMIKGTTVHRIILENSTLHINTLNAGGTLPPLPPVNRPHSVTAGNILSGGIQTAARAARQNHRTISRTELRKAWAKSK